MAFDRTITGAADHLDVEGETVLVRGPVQSARVGAGGILHIQGAIAGAGTFTVENGGTLRVDGAVLGPHISILDGGQAILMGLLQGSIENAGGLIIHAQGPVTDLRVTGAGPVLRWEDLDDETKRMMPAPETAWSVKHG